MAMYPMHDALHTAIAEALGEAGYLSTSAVTKKTTGQTAPLRNQNAGVTQPRRAHWLPLLAAVGSWSALSLGIVACIQDELAARSSNRVSAHSRFEPAPPTPR